MSKIDTNETLVVRNFDIKDFRASEEDYNLEGHAAVFNQAVSIGGWFTEIIERGAFDGCDLSDVSLFVNHNDNTIPLARSRENNNNSTMKLEVDDKGLFIRAKLDIDNNQEAKTLHSSVSRGDIDGMSFSFRIKEQVWENLDTKMPTRRIKKISKVYEVSAVNHPAYSNTDVNARDKKALDNAIKEIKEARNINDKNTLEIERLKIEILNKREV
ncbi:MAG: HK97 family phage prohead protease [Cetobacterium sp.]|nr:HK97 family phage prohead protease [Cetobacterium sp.]DAF09362.1 MAG TPA: prohead serine protease [Caudoviricetes sp.]